MSNSIKLLLTIMAVVAIGTVLGLLMAPAIAAARPQPAPVVTVKRVEVWAADRLDTGGACLYTWDGEVFTWSRAALDTVSKACPSRAIAQARWVLSQHAPTRVVDSNATDAR